MTSLFFAALLQQESIEEAILKKTAPQKTKKTLWTFNSWGRGQFNVSLLVITHVMTANPNKACGLLWSKQKEPITHCTMSARQGLNNAAW